MLQEADPHPYRDAVRDALLAQDGEASRKLASQRQAAEQPPDFVAFFCERGDITFERRRELLVAAVRRQPDNLGVLVALGLTSPPNGKEGAGERVLWFQAAVGAAPRNGIVHCCLGEALYFAGRKDDALASLEQATRLAPDYYHTHFNLGNVLAEKGRFDEAIACFRKAIDLDPKNAYARCNLGDALVAKGRGGRGHRQHRKAIELDPNFPCPPGPGDLYYNNGNALRWQGPGGRGHRLLQEGHRTRPEVRRGPLQPGSSVGSSGPVRRVPGGLAAGPRVGDQKARLALPLGRVGSRGRAEGRPGRQAARVPQGRVPAQGHDRNDSVWPVSARPRSSTTPRPDCTPTPSPPTPSWPTTCKPGTGTTPPVPPRSRRRPGRGRRQARRQGATTGCASRPSTGCGPT